MALVAGGDLRGSAPAIGAMLLAALLYAVSAHVARRRFATFEPQAVALIQAVVGAAVVTPLAVAVEQPEAVPSAAAVASLLALSLGGRPSPTSSTTRSSPRPGRSTRWPSPTSLLRRRSCTAPSSSANGSAPPPWSGWG